MPTFNVLKNRCRKIDAEKKHNLFKFKNISLLFKRRYVDR